MRESERTHISIPWTGDASTEAHAGQQERWPTSPDALGFETTSLDACLAPALLPFVDLHTSVLSHTLVHLTKLPKRDIFGTKDPSDLLSEPDDEEGMPAR